MARPPVGRSRSGALERAGAGVARAPHSAARAGHPRRAVRPCRDGREPPPGAALAAGRRRAARPAPRSGDREPLEGGVALARAGLPVAPARRCLGRGARARSGRGRAPDAGICRWSRGTARLSPRRPAVPALRSADPVPRAGRRQPDGLLVPELPERRGSGRGVTESVAVRAPHLYRALRCFCLAAFSLLSQEDERGESLPLVVEEHPSGRGRASLYEYRPLVRSYVDSRVDRLAAPADAQIALEELAREPAAAVYAAAHAGRRGDRALIRTILLPLLTDVGEACGGFDWDDAAFERVYEAFEHTLLGERRLYAALAPGVGLSIGATLELAGGLRSRLAATGELAAHWPKASGLLPEDFGREPDRLCVLELERVLDRSALETPDA